MANGPVGEDPRTVAYGCLRDGTQIRIRPVRPGDRAAVLEFLRRLSRDSLELRFFSAVTLEVVTHEILQGSVGAGRASVVAETVTEPPARIIGHAEYSREARDPSRAEAAFLIEDDHQGLGAGTLLLRRLARNAREEGIRYLVAIVLPENRAMLDMVTGAGYPHTTSWTGGEARVELDIGRDPAPVSRWAAVPTRAGVT
ncbi:MAG TPA: GNAT family N-acetyltransferase [Thermoplasmata archaeon]|nr:GNAT family N-acetyltransferase [Thermoplasmata archaeon]